jgi:secernin
LCDTLAAVPGTTRDGTMLFAKSADCEVNEANALVRIPRRRHAAGEAVRLTHLVIPQAAETFEVLLTKAFWTWGCEIGVNEHGLCMGEEAVFTTEMHEEKDGIIGPDLMRIALERTRTCREAIQLMTRLLEEYGQGGSAELKGNSHFDSSVLIADPQEAWILETAGRKWATRRIPDTGSISNMLGIRTDWDRCSVESAASTPAAARLDWAARFGLPEVPAALGSPQRQAITSSTLQRERGRISARTIFDIMRDHGEGYHPATAPVHSGVCLHAGPQKDRWWQADGVMVADVKPGDTLVWVTGTSGNCVSIFKPVFTGVDLPDIGPVPTETADPLSLWWRHEQLHRRAMADFEHVVPEIRADFDRLEESFLSEAPSVRGATAALKRRFTEDCFRRAIEATEAWITRLRARGDLGFADPGYRAMWRTVNAAAGLTGLPA